MGPWDRADEVNLLSPMPLSENQKKNFGIILRLYRRLQLCLFRCVVFVTNLSYYIASLYLVKETSVLKEQ